MHMAVCHKWSPVDSIARSYSSKRAKLYKPSRPLSPLWCPKRVSQPPGHPKGKAGAGLRLCLFPIKSLPSGAHLKLQSPPPLLLHWTGVPLTGSRWINIPPSPPPAEFQGSQIAAARLSHPLQSKGGGGLRRKSHRTKPTHHHSFTMLQGCAERNGSRQGHLHEASANRTWQPTPLPLPCSPAFSGMQNAHGATSPCLLAESLLFQRLVQGLGVTEEDLKGGAGGGGSQPAPEGRHRQPGANELGEAHLASQ